MKYVIKLCGVLFSLSKTLFLLMFANMVLTAARPIVSVVLSARIIQLLVENTAFWDIMLVAIALAVFNLAVGLLLAVLGSYISILNETVKDDFMLRIGKKTMRLPYEKLESAAFLDLQQQALVPMIQWGNFEFILHDAIPKILGSFITIIATAALVAHGNLLLLIPIAAVAVVCMLIAAKRQQTMNAAMSRMGLIERKMNYYSQLATDFSAGKEVRLFGMDSIIMKKIRDFNDRELGEFTKMLNSSSRFDVIEVVFTQVMVFVIYGVVVLDVIHNGLPIGNFFETTGLFANVSAAVFVLLSTASAAHARGHILQKYFEFNSLDEATDSRSDSDEIAIKNVSFSYADKAVLKNINLDIPAGQKIALVGENGSGKTTLVKLICGLLTPTEGTVTVGERMTAVFQDFRLFSFTIAENVAMTEKFDEAAVLDAVQRVGLLSDTDGIETFLQKSFDSAGIELSGGQGQKLAIARAIYRDASTLLLDEPTAALDPKTEAEIFDNFCKISEGKTAIMVSHRLSACRLCDIIVVLKDGCIVERGTHEELVQIADGVYSEMWQAQAEYYQ